MAIETATWLSDLDPANPKGVDQRSTADDHVRLCKKVWVNSFPNINAEVSASAGVLNFLVGVTSNIQTQIDTEAATRETTSATLQFNIHLLSATMAKTVNASSDALVASIETLSATLNASKLDTGATAASAILWDGAAKVVGNQTASVSAGIAVGDLGFII